MAAIVPACQRDPQPRKPGGANRPVPVTVAKAVRQDVPLEYDTFGYAQTVATVQVKAQVSEVLRKVHVSKGQRVEAGGPLFDIDPEPFETSLRQAQAVLARDRILAANLRLDFQRQEELFKRKVAARAEYDKAKADAEAAAELVKVEEAAVANMALQLKHCRIVSPIAGRVGNLLVDEGNLVKANDQTLVVINQISPIEVFFSVPQSMLGQVRQRMHQDSGDGLVVEAAIPDDSGPPQRGVLTFVDNNVDKTSATVQLGALFANADERLWPGQYVRVKLVLDLHKGAVVVPARAVQTGRDEKYAFVIGADNKARKRTVVVDRTHNNLCLIRSGIAAGEQVVTDGQLRLRDGAAVMIKGAPKAPGTKAPATGPRGGDGGNQ